MTNPYKKKLGPRQLKGGNEEPTEDLDENEEPTEDLDENEEPTEDLVKNEETDCPICMKHIDENKKITTKCYHDFHRECFKQNCLAELTKGDFRTRDEENEVFQCPICRGDTKADCLNNPEVRAKYEELHEGLHLNRNVIGDTDDRLQFQNMIHILEVKLKHTIQRSENGFINAASQELFLVKLHANLNNYFVLSNGDLSNADLGYMLEVFEALLTAAVRGRYGLVQYSITEFTDKIRDGLYAFEEHGENNESDDEFMGGRNKSKKRGKRKTKKSKGKVKGKKTKKGKKQNGIKKTKKGKRKSRRRNGGTITQGF